MEVFFVSNSIWLAFVRIESCQQVPENVGTSSSINVHNIGVGTSSDTNNPLDANDIDECLRNNEEDEGNEAGFSLHDTPADYLF